MIEKNEKLVKLLVRLHEHVIQIQQYSKIIEDLWSSISHNIEMVQKMGPAIKNFMKYSEKMRAKSKNPLDTILPNMNNLVESLDAIREMKIDIKTSLPAPITPKQLLID